MGGLGDGLLLRRGFHEREGTPPGEVRWTRERFQVDFPVWPGERCNEVVLYGLLHRAVRDRRIAVAVDAGTPGRLGAEGHFATDAAGEYALRLPAPLGPGIHRLDFTVGTWSPREAGLGDDPRRLGFYLDAIGLREGK